MNEKPLKRFWIIIFLCIFAFYAMIPIVLVAFTSFKTSQELFQNVIAPPSKITWKNYVQVWEKAGFKNYFMNSVIIALPTVLCVVIFATLSGYAFAKMKFVGKNILFYLVLGGLMLPLPSIIIPLYQNLHLLGILNTRLGVALVEMSIAMPFGIFLMKTFIESIPNELLEAARIDGAGEMKIIWRLIFPLAGPGIKSLALIEFMWVWQSYLLPLILITEDKIKPLTAALDIFIGRYSISYNLIATGSIIVFIPITIVFLFTQKSFIEGITMGSIK